VDDLTLDETTREKALLSLLLSLNQQIGAGAALEDLLQEIAESVCRLSCAASASVMLLDDRRQELLCRASHGLPPEEMAAISFRVGEGIAGWVAEKGEALRVPNTAADPRFLRIAAQKTSLGSLCCVPMLARGAVIGVITAGSPENDCFSADDQELLCYMTAAIAKEVENARLYRLAVTDPLTGAFNRQHLGERLPTEVERHRRYGQQLSLMVIDVDHFKAVNDRHGHPVGDQVLRGLTRRIDELVRDVDFLVRYGGEEFLAVLPSTALDGARQVAERLRAQVAQTPIASTAGSISVTVSVGVAELSDEDVDGMALIERADAALYRAKAAGRDRVVVAEAQ